GALLWLAFELVAAAGDEGNLHPGRAAGAGLLASWATLCEFPAVLIAGLLFVFICIKGRRSWRGLLAFALAGLPALIILMVYNKVAFGKAFASGYQFHAVQEFRDAMSEGVMGVTWPRWESVLGVFLLPYRGLLWFWPFFLCVLGAAMFLLAR